MEVEAVGEGEAHTTNMGTRHKVSMQSRMVQCHKEMKIPRRMPPTMVDKMPKRKYDGAAVKKWWMLLN